MLPDAGYRLKWTYGVEAFQQWCAQRNRPILAATGEGLREFVEFPSKKEQKSFVL